MTGTAVAPYAGGAPNPTFDFAKKWGIWDHILSPAGPALSQTAMGAAVPQALFVRSLNRQRQKQLAWRTVANDPLASRLAGRLFELKTLTAQFAMHLESEWRAGLFAQLDYLMCEENWEAVDPIPAPESYRTALRLIILLGHVKRPGLGFDIEGNIVLAWTEGADRLTIECRPNDVVRWIVSYTVDGERDSAAGKTKVARLPTVLAAFEPARWLALQ
ncbi:MAG: hypothetical protein K9G59_11210 [Caulobacter sp.]|nr:hypothetical protein [Caulobacter sp.]